MCRKRWDYDPVDTLWPEAVVKINSSGDDEGTGLPDDGEYDESGTV